MLGRGGRIETLCNGERERDVVRIMVGGSGLEG